MRKMRAYRLQIWKRYSHSYTTTNTISTTTSTTTNTFTTTTTTTTFTATTTATTTTTTATTFTTTATTTTTTFTTTTATTTTTTATTVATTATTTTATTKGCWTYSLNTLIIKISPCCTCAKTCFHRGNMPRGRNAHYFVAFKNPRDQLGMKNLLLQAFPTCWQDMMDVYQKVTKRPFGYMVLDLHPASDDRKRMFSHLLTQEGYQRWHRKKAEDD